LRAIKTKKLQKLPVNFEPEFRKFFQSKKIPALIDLNRAVRFFDDWHSRHITKNSGLWIAITNVTLDHIKS